METARRRPVGIGRMVDMIGMGFVLIVRISIEDIVGIKTFFICLNFKPFSFLARDKISNKVRFL